MSAEEKADVPLRDRFYTNLNCLKITYDLMNKPGLLLVSVDNKDKPNVMAIGVGAIAPYPKWPIFIIWVRPSRYTYGLIEKTGDFTVNVPREGMNEIVTYCGTVSGRDYDKFKDKKLTPAASRFITSPIIGECAIHYECKVIDKYDTGPENMEDSLRASHTGGDFHRLYFGQIVATYADKNLLVE